MKKDWELSQEAFDALLAWLDSDREQAALKYEKIRRALIKIFTGRGCVEPEDLADETINRVTKKLKEIEKDFTGDRTRYFFGVAKMVHLEHLRRKIPQVVPTPPNDPTRIELEYSCLERCIDQLSKDDRDRLLRYYGADSRNETEHRRALAEEMGIGPNALRIRIYRIRQTLKECVEKCVARSLG
jgi:DNA-directed RNA polymerase specialized sigma24 family protein